MKCPVCSSTRLSPETETGTYNTAFRSGFRLDGTLKVVQIDRGRICGDCGDCGHVLLFASRDELAKIGPDWDQIMPNER